MDEPLPFPPPEVPAEFWLHVYKKTPFMYFSRNSIWRAVIKIAENIKTSGMKNMEKSFEQFRNSSFVLPEKFIKEQRSLLDCFSSIE